MPAGLALTAMTHNPRFSPHLTFDGQCRQAFEGYRDLFGGTLQTLLTYGESPLAAHTHPKWHSRIVHATLKCADVELAGVDVMPQDYVKPQGFFVTVTLAHAARAAEIFRVLAVQGEVRLPFQSTFWSPGFGVVIDRYAIPWEIQCDAKPAG